MARRCRQRTVDDYFGQARRPRLEPTYVQNPNYAPGKNCWHLSINKFSQ